MYAVQLNEVKKSYGTLCVLDGVSLSVDTGEVVAVIGKSGSGKSTMLRCINGLEPIQGGSIDVVGHKLVAGAGNLKNLRSLRQEVGMVFQSYNLFPHLNVTENIMLALRVVKKIAKDEALETAQFALRRVGLAEKAGSYPDQLSGGQQQRVAIARSLAMKPKVMLFDEVTSALDPQLTGEVLKTISELAESGMTMILVSHEMGFARQVANTTIFMNQGKIWESGPSKDIFSNPKTAELQKFLVGGEASDK